jgi:hypothetical protein
MYYKKYRIVANGNDNFKDIIIFRFIFNDNGNDNENDNRTNEDRKILSDLKELAKNDELSYNNIYPWDDIDISFNYKNKEVIIAYNNDTNHIQGWCNIEYSTFSEGDKPTNLYNLKIDKLVSREIPKIKYIGLLLLEFIRDECLNKPLLYYNNYLSKYEEVNIVIMYLYSLTTTINYYKKTFLTQLYLYNQTEQESEIYEHIFISINPIYINKISKKIKKYISQLNILHLFECNSILSPSSIKNYNNFKIKDIYRKPNKKPKSLIDNENENENENDYYYNNCIYGSRKRKINN